MTPGEVVHEYNIEQGLEEALGLSSTLDDLKPVNKESSNMNMNMFDAKRFEAIRAVAGDGLLLQSLQAHLRDDKEVVLSAITCKYNSKYLNADVVQYASPRLKDDFDVMQAAVRQDGDILCEASTRLKDNDVLVLDAVYNTPIAMEWASKRLKTDPACLYVLEHRKGITNEEWPLVKQALLEEPDRFFDPTIYATVEGTDRPWVALADYALHKDIKMDTNEELPTFSWNEETNSEAWSEGETFTNYEEELRDCRTRMEQKKAQSHEQDR